MFDVGRLCLKIAGRDAGKRCVVVDVVNGHTVLVDGETRRREVNVLHLEPTPQHVDLKKGASHADVKHAFEQLGLKVLETKPKTKGARPMRVRGSTKKAAQPKASKKAKKVSAE